MRSFAWLALALIVPAHAHAAKEAHGGFFVACGQEIEVVDFLEGQVNEMELPALPSGEADNIVNWYKVLVEQAARKYPLEYQQVRADFEHQFLMLDSQSQPVAESRIPVATADLDSGMVVPRGCVLKQVAGWWDNEIEFYVLAGWYDRAPARVRAEILFHEAVYRLTIGSFVLGGDYARTRGYVAYLGMRLTDRSRYDPQFAQAQWSDHGWPRPGLPGQLPGRH